MEKFVIKGGKPLKGVIEVRGAKNAALKILAASILSDKEWIVKNVPFIGDIFRMKELVSDLGLEAKIDSENHWRLRTARIKKTELDRDLVGTLRASIVLTGPILARKGEVKFSYPGGCLIGRRPIDMFLAGFKEMGVKINETKEGFKLTTSGLRGAKIVFPKISVTGTETLMMAATLARGKTILINTACEPEISALAQFLNQSGAKIKGAGTNTIEIEGVKNLLNGGTLKIIPDRLETGTFAILAAATASPIKIINCQPLHLEVLWAVLKSAGVGFEIGQDWVLVKPTKKLKAVNIQTKEYPGFPTDLQAPFAVLMTQAKGKSLLHETIFEGRLKHIKELQKMGACAEILNDHQAIVEGPTNLYGTQIRSIDLRAGASLIIAALVAKGESEISDVYQIDRGYEKIEERLARLGANIKRV